MKNTLFILCGEAFSGKSTLAKKLAERYEAKIVGRDIVYFALQEKLALEITLDEDDVSLWNNLWPIALQGAKNQISARNSVVFDDNCFLFEQRKQLRELAQESGIKSVLLYVNTPFDLLKKRKEENKITQHRHDIPSEWLAEDTYKFERPTETEQPIIVTPDMELETIINLLEKQ